MLFSQDRRQLRQMYADAWHKFRTAQTLSDLESQIAAVVALHPEYHDALAGDNALERDFVPEGGASNPFLHMSLHLGIRDQVATNRPFGISAVYDALRARLGDEHAAEHVLLERLGEALWRSQRDAAPPDEQRYLQALREDLRKLGASAGR